MSTAGLENCDDSAAPGQGAAGEAGAGATSYNRNLVAIRQFDDVHHVLLVAREGDGVGPRLFHRTVILV